MVLALLAGLASGITASGALPGYIKMRSGYFYDSATGDTFVPHGIAYQTWNRPLGVWQTKSQIDYDLDEMVKMGANSIRVDFVWQHIEEDGDNQWKWENYDYLVQAAEARGIRIFALIGYQWPPNWFPDEWYTQHPPATDAEGIYHPTRWQSDIINYEHPQARAQYAEWFQNVCSRYKHSKAIVCWIIGNESGYLGLWSGLLDGYDPESEAAFRTWCQAKYATVTNLNARWGTGYANFPGIKFVEEYREYGPEGAQWADMVQWREDSIGTFTAIGAKAAKTADTNHMIAYSTVGMQWGEEDWRYHAEDRGKITSACAATNAPVDLFAVNNYPWSILGHESQNGHWGISYTKKITSSPALPDGVPVLYSETGFTSSETMWEGMDQYRQGPLIRNALWESLEAGAIGTHVFAWHDRPYITDREKGFGILTPERHIKPAFWDCLNAFQLMEQAKISQLLGGSKDPTPDIGFLWTAANDSQYNRYECEMQQVAGALERVGYEPNFVRLEDLASGAYTNFKVLVLPRNMRVDREVPGTGKGVLKFLRENVLPKGIHILATADLPGMQDENGRTMADFTNEAALLFGIDASDVGGFEVPPRTKVFISDNMKRIRVKFNHAVGALTNGYTVTPAVWKYNDEVKVSDGTLWGVMDTGGNKGFEDNADGSGILSGWDGTWTNTGAGLYVRSNWGWQYAGSNMLQVWGDAVMWKNFQVVPFGRYSCSAFLRSNSGDPLRDGSYASIAFEWYGKNDNYLGITESEHLTSATSGGVSESPNLVKNPGFETNGANWSVTGQLNIEDGFAAYAAETGSFGAWITNNQGDHYIYQQIPANVWSPNYGNTFVYRVRARKTGAVPGAIKLELYHPWVAVTNIDITSALTTNWQTFSLYYRPTAGADQVLELRLRNATGGSGTGQVLYDNAYLGLTNTVASGDGWVKFSVDAVAPSNTYTARKLIRCGFENLLANGSLTGSGLAPNSWAQWNDGSHDPCTSVFAGTSGNAWTFWWDGGIYQDIASGFSAGDTVKFGGYLYTPNDDRLRNGTKYGVIQLEFYNGDSLLSSASAAPAIGWSSTNDIWLPSTAQTTVPAGTTRLRLIVRCNDYANGDGRFVADDIFVRNQSKSGGSLYVDNLHENPALVVKNHGTAKAAIFLFSAGDILPDGSGDGKMDVLPWKWRYDYFGAIVKDYFGVQPPLQVVGANAYLCLAEYRTCTNGATLWQVKNYMYDTNYANGGPDATFTIQSSLFNGKTIRAFEQGKVIETNSDGLISIVLKPDGHEMLMAYAPGTNRQEVCQISAGPGVVHPGGDRVYEIKVMFDCLLATNLNLRLAFKEAGNNGDALTNEIYAIQTNLVRGAGETNFFMWIPPYNQADSDYKSTPDGGRYEFAAWLENPVGVKIAQAAPRATVLEWGVRPTAAVPTNMTKGGTTTLPFEWEELYEPLSWQNTPMARNDGFPTRIAVLRSSKTEGQYPGHFNKVNAASDWLETLGYVAGNPLDISFDNVTASNGTVFSDNFEDGNYNGWTRTAGCANWAVQAAALSHGKPFKYALNTSFTLNNATRKLSFKVAADLGKTVDRVYIYGARTGVSPTFKLDLVKDNGGLPGSEALATANFAFPTNVYNWVAIDLPNYNWSAGAAYHLVLSYVSGTINATNCATVQYVGPDTTGRKVLYSTTGGSTWITQNYEPVFRVLYSDGSSFSQPYASYSSVGVNGGRYGQQFTLTESTSVSNIAIYIRKDSTVNGNVRMLLRRWSDKAILATSTVSRTLVATTNNWVNFAFSPSVLLGGSTQYFFDVMNLGTTGSFWCIRENTLGNYGAYTWDGTARATVYSANTGLTWSAQTHYDLGYVLSGSTLNKALRIWRIGNSDNILAAGSTYTNCTVSANIRYNKQDNYFDDAEVYFHYKDRGNYYRVGIRNFYAFWRLKYVVMANSNIVAQGWLYDFAKTNRPVENAWYNLKIDAKGSTNKVFFNNVHVGTFWATNVPSGRIGVGSRALQLGNWEPQKGFYFVDDDEWSFWAPEGQPQTQGKPLDLDYGYLKAFFNTFVLPDVYVMSDIEVSNLRNWLTGGLNSIIAFDGGTAMKNETGAFDMGRIEDVFGVSASTKAMSNVTKVVVGQGEHYITLDYGPGSQVAARGTGTSYTAVTTGSSLGTVQNGSTAPGLIAHVLMDNPDAPVKVFCFNYPADTLGQLGNEAKKLAQRAFEWCRGNAFKCQIALMYDAQTGDPSQNFIVYKTNVWVLGGSGSNSVSVTLPTDGIMTGTNLFWTYTVYPWDATDLWTYHAGYYGSDADGGRVRLAGKGLQVLGGPTNVYGGRGWDLWLAYNTEGQACTLTFGLQDKGVLASEDNFDDGNYAGWTVTAHPNIGWSVTGGALRASVVSTGGYASITRDGLALNTNNITIEYNTRFMNGARHGGVIYRGLVLYVNPQLCGWADLSPYYITNGAGVTTGQWHHVVVNIRDGDPYLRSDLTIDGKTVFMDEALEVNSFANNTMGFLSPYHPGYAEWDNVRVTDEQYSFVTQTVNGVYYPVTNETPFYARVPDFDPGMMEHEGTTLGGAYQFYAYLKGQGVHGATDTEVYFSPQIMIEHSNFPAVMNPGQLVNLPVQWERLPQTPMKLMVNLQDVWSGRTYLTNFYTISSATGSGLFPVTIPEEIVSGAGYAWQAVICPTNEPDPIAGQLGNDDTFRYTRDGLALKEETTVIVTPIVGGDYAIYRDLGIPAGSDIFTWDGGSSSFDGNYAGATPPEGSLCFRADTATWAGWGVLATANALDISEYRDGLLKFWLKSMVTVKVELEQWSGAKVAKYIPTTSNVWKEIVVPMSDFSSLTLAQMKGLFEITAETATGFYVDHVRFVKGELAVYNDYGVPALSRITNWSSGAASFNASYTEGAAPEGSKCYMTTGSAASGWGVVMTNGVMNMSLYSNGYISLWARSWGSLKLEIEVPQGVTRTTYIGSTTGIWKQITLPLSVFGGFNYAQVYGLAKVSSTNAAKFFVDNIRWRRGTNAVPSEKKETFFSDAGIPGNAQVLTWWAYQYWEHISAAISDGGFESSTDGLFPNSGFWAFTNATSGAGALCSTAALRSGAKGLREQTSANGSYWASTYQEISGYAGDIYNAHVYVRQPSGQGWVAGSTAYVRMQFLNAWRQVLTNVVSAVKVTTAAQAWTLCSIPDFTAPYATRFVRFELVVQKPNGSTGASVADFDDGWWGQANSFNANFAEDPVTPEGAKSFRSYCVGWSGWNVIYSNTVTNLSQYAGGYLKFWYKSSGYTKVEIQSVWNGVTNQAAYPAFGWFGPTVNDQGAVVWQQKVIPISYFVGIDLQHIKSPFMITDPTYDHAFYVDDVRWTISP
ncbi:MAG: hypothetical protein A2X46_13410 [Lentisphaerae bacterium GWF2_57_35]|nr:MAG: hypothetical protein A2X46_13410 [Lentisphaerae bacterium GWF2_57_35]